MSKIQELLGALAVVIFSACFIWSVLGSALIMPFTPVIPKGSSTAQLVAGLLFLLSLYGLTLGIMTAIGKTARIFPKRDYHLLGVPIPWYFAFGLAPLPLGLGLVLITGETQWGTGLAALSIPCIVIFMILHLNVDLSSHPNNGPIAGIREDV